MSTDNAVFSNPNIWHNHRAKTEKTPISDFDKGILIEYPHSDLHWVMYVGIGMGHVYNSAMPGHGYIVANDQPRMTDKMNILLDINVVPDTKFRDAFLIGDDDLHPHSWSDIYVAADMNKSGVAQEKWLEHDGTVAEAGKDETVVEHALQVVERSPQSVELFWNGVTYKR
jgi:hypothetical protein